MLKGIRLRKPALVLAAFSLALGALAPAYAGGRHHGGYGHGWRGHGHGHHYYYGSRHYRRHHHGHGLGAGEAALLAAGIIGGVILIDRAIENERARERYYSRAYEPYYAGYEPAPARDFYYRRDDRFAGDESEFHDNGGLDALAGGPADRGPSYNYGAAYNDCKAEIREAAGDGGLLVALPARPQRIEPIEGGAAVRFTADILARDLAGAEYRRVVTCEADARGVRFLEIA